MSSNDQTKISVLEPDRFNVEFILPEKYADVVCFKRLPFDPSPAPLTFQSKPIRVYAQFEIEGCKESNKQLPNQLNNISVIVSWPETEKDKIIGVHYYPGKNGEWENLTKGMNFQDTSLIKDGWIHAEAKLPPVDLANGDPCIGGH